MGIADSQKPNSLPSLLTTGCFLVIRRGDEFDPRVAAVLLLLLDANDVLLRFHFLLLLLLALLVLAVLGGRGMGVGVLVRRGGSPVVDDGGQAFLHDDGALEAAGARQLETQLLPLVVLVLLLLGLTEGKKTRRQTGESPVGTHGTLPPEMSHTDTVCGVEIFAA